MTYTLDDNPEDIKDTKRLYSMAFERIEIIPVYQTPGSLAAEQIAFPSPCGTYILMIDKPTKFSTMNDTNDFHSGWY